MPEGKDAIQRKFSRSEKCADNPPPVQQRQTQRPEWTDSVTVLARDCLPGEPRSRNAHRVPTDKRAM